MLVALKKIETQTYQENQHTFKKCYMLMDYPATHPLAIIRYHASDMILHVDSDAAYLVQPNARSRYAGHFFLSSNPPPLPAKPIPECNGSIMNVCKNICNVVASAAE